MKKCLYLLSLPLLAVACGDDGGSSDPAEVALVEAAEAHSDAFYGGDGETMWTFISTRCQAMYDRDDFIREIDLAGVEFGDESSRVKVEKIDGDRAVVSHDSSNDALDVVRNWVRENGAWRWDGC